MWSFNPVYRWARACVKLIRLIKNNNKITKLECREVLWKTVWQASTSEHVAAAGADSNTKFKWSDDLAEELLKALNNFKTVMEFQNKYFSGDKPRQYEEVRKKLALWALVSVMWNILDHFLYLCFPVIWMMRRKLDFYLHWCPTHTFLFAFSFCGLIFSIGCLTLLSQNNIVSTNLFRYRQ